MNIESPNIESATGIGSYLIYALKLSLNNTKQISLLNVHLQADDPSPAMRRLGAHLGNLVNGENRSK
jgi:hypothetical protein